MSSEHKPDREHLTVAREWIEMDMELDEDQVLEYELMTGERLVDRTCEYGHHGSGIYSCDMDADPGSLYCSAHAESM